MALAKGHRKGLQLQTHFTSRDRADSLGSTLDFSAEVVPATAWGSQSRQWKRSPWRQGGRRRTWAPLRLWRWCSALLCSGVWGGLTGVWTFPPLC